MDKLKPIYYLLSVRNCKYYLVVVLESSAMYRY